MAEANTDEDSLKDRYLTFVINQEDYGIPISHVTEIVGMQKITQVPDLPEFLIGVINLRGSIIPVLDVRTRFHLEKISYNERTCVIVVRIRDASVGLVVDSVQEVIGIPAENISPPPRLGRPDSARFVQGIGKVSESVKILLDVEKLLREEELENLPAQSKSPDPLNA